MLRISRRRAITSRRTSRCSTIFRPARSARSPRCSPRRCAPRHHPHGWRGLIDLGGGVAFRIDSPELLAIRARIADRFHGLLTPQDRAAPRLHVTVQNKVPAVEARALRAELERDFVPRRLAIAGLAAWHYRGGPWELAARKSFRG